MNRTADLVLMYEKNIEDAIELCKEDTPKKGNSGPKSISDPTAQKAIKHICADNPEAVYVEFGARVAGKCSVFCLKRPAYWLTACKKTWEHYKDNPTGHMLMELRYKKGITDMGTVAKTIGISSQRAYIVLDLIHRYLTDYAAGMGATIIGQERAERVTDILKTLKEKR